MKAMARFLLAVIGRLFSGHVVVRGGSMLPGLAPGDYLAVDRLAYVLAEPGRGDVVVFRGRDGMKARQIKRVIGLPGEVVRLAEGRVWVDGVELDEPYVEGLPRTTGLQEREWTVGAGEVFVMGDNRPASTDSRDHGPVPRARMEGRAWLRYWPLGRFGRRP